MAMKNSTVLLALTPEVPLDALAQNLEAIRAIPARAVLLIVAELPSFSYYSGGMVPYAPTEISPAWDEAMETLKTAAKAKTEALKTLLLDHDVSGEIATVICEPALVAENVARHAMLCDVAWITDDLRAQNPLFRSVVHGVLFQSPIGVLLNDRDAKVLSGSKRAFVAWTAHLQSARAVHQALPLLRQADEVIVGTIDPVMTEFRDGQDPGVDAAKWLTHHGCKVVVQQSPSGGKDVGACILDRAKEAGADLIVMGAYGHSRAREAIFGGTTRMLVEQVDQAVFLAH